MRAHICFLEFGHVGDPPNGPRRITRETARALALAGHDVHIVGRGGVAREDVDDAGVHRHDVVVRDLGLPGLDGFAARDDLYAGAAKHARILALHCEAPFDLVAVTRSHGEGLVCLLDPRLPVVLRAVTPMSTVAAAEPWLAGGDQVTALERLEREAVTRASHVHAATRAIADVLDEGVPGPAGRQVVVEPLGLLDRALPGASRAADRGGGGAHAASEVTEILFVGRLEYRKGIDVLLDAVRRLVAGGRAVHVTIVGADMGRDADGRLLREVAAADPALGGAVTFAGTVSDTDLWARYAAADIVCVPSRYESFGIVLVEAMMFGRAVVTCPVGGIPEVVVAGETALFAEPGDASSLAARLAELIEDPSRRAELGAAGRDRYLACFDAATTAPRTLDALLALVRRRPDVGDGTEAGGGTDAGYGTEAGGGTVAGDNADAGDNAGDDTHAEAALRAGLSEAVRRVAELAPAAAAETAVAILAGEGPVEPPDTAAALARAWLADDAAWVDETFVTVLGRRPLAGDRSRWLAGLAAAGRRRDLVAELLGSAEVARRGLACDWLPELDARLGAAAAARLAAAAAEPDDEAFVRSAALVVLGRAAAPDERAAWLGHLRAGGARADVVAALTGSEEAAAYPAGGNGTAAPAGYIRTSTPTS